MPSKTMLLWKPSNGGWDRLVNGDLIAAAEAAGFELLLTTDKNMLAFVVLGNQQWPILRRYVEKVVAAVNAAAPGSYIEVDIPFV
jgi:hypothetical protein